MAFKATPNILGQNSLDESRTLLPFSDMASIRKFSIDFVCYWCFGGLHK